MFFSNKDAAFTRSFGEFCSKIFQRCQTSLQANDEGETHQQKYGTDSIKDFKIVNYDSFCSGYQKKTLILNLIAKYLPLLRPLYLSLNLTFLESLTLLGLFYAKQSVYYKRLILTLFQV